MQLSARQPLLVLATRAIHKHRTSVAHGNRNVAYDVLAAGTVHQGIVRIAGIGQLCETARLPLGIGCRVLTRKQLVTYGHTSLGVIKDSFQLVGGDVLGIDQCDDLFICQFSFSLHREIQNACSSHWPKLKYKVHSHLLLT